MVKSFKQWRGKEKPKRDPSRTGHSGLMTQSLTDAQLNDIKSKGKTTIILRGERREITDCNVLNGAIQYYKRSDLSSPGDVHYSIRDYCKDQNTKASHKLNPGKGGMTGD